MYGPVEQGGNVSSLTSHEPRAAHAEARPVANHGRRRRLLLVAAILAFTVGLGSIIGGVAGAAYTHSQAVAENVVTPDDASIPGTPVRGPLTMKAQSDVIRGHTLERTEGLAYAELPRSVPQVDEAGNAALDENGDPVMVPNTARDLWLTATTLTTALNLGILAYALAAFAVVVGLVLVASGGVFLTLRKPEFLLA
jgi:hypothetical protein